VDRDNSIWGVRQENLINQLIAFRIYHGNVGPHWRYGGGISSIGEVVPGVLRIDPTDIKTHQPTGDADCGQMRVGALVVVALVVALVVVVLVVVVLV
jgi:hypothetical protein